MSTNLVRRVGDVTPTHPALESPLTENGDTVRYAEIENDKETIRIIEATGRPSHDIAKKISAIHLSPGQSDSAKGTVRIVVKANTTDSWTTAIQALTMIVGIVSLVAILRLLSNF